MFNAHNVYCRNRLYGFPTFGSFESKFPIEFICECKRPTRLENVYISRFYHNKMYLLKYFFFIFIYLFVFGIYFLCSGRGWGSKVRCVRSLRRALMIYLYARMADMCSNYEKLNNMHENMFSQIDNVFVCACVRSMRPSESEQTPTSGRRKRVLNG